MSTAKKVGRTGICHKEKPPVFPVIQNGSFSDPRAKAGETFSLRAKSKKKNKISFNCQILDQKLPFHNHTTTQFRYKTGTVQSALESRLLAQFSKFFFFQTVPGVRILKQFSKFSRDIWLSLRKLRRKIAK